MHTINSMDVNKNKSRVIIKIAFIVYLLFLGYVLFFAEAFGRQGVAEGYRYNLTLFQEIERYIRIGRNGGWNLFLINVVGNVLAFVPFGFFAPLIFMRCKHMVLTAMLSFEVSLFVELLQLVTKVGSFDVDDLLLNTIGGVLGFCMFAIGRFVKKKFFQKKDK